MNKKVIIIISLIVIVLLVSNKEKFQYSEQLDDYTLPCYGGYITQNGDKVDITLYSDFTLTTAESNKAIGKATITSVVFYTSSGQGVGYDPINSQVRYINGKTIIYVEGMFLPPQGEVYYLGLLYLSHNANYLIPREISMYTISTTGDDWRSGCFIANLQGGRITLMHEGITSVDPHEISIEEITENSVKLKVKTLNRRDSITFELYKGGNVIESKLLEISDDNTHYISFTNLERATNYSVNYYGIINGALEFRTLGEVIPIIITPLSTERTENSFLRTFRITPKDSELKVTLFHNGQETSVYPQHDSIKDIYLVKFDNLEPETTYTYTIKAWEYGYETENFDKYTDQFTTMAEPHPTTTSVIIHENKVENKTFYLKFEIDGQYNQKTFKYRKENITEEKAIVSYSGYETVFVENLEEGTYEWSLIVTTDEGDITKEGDFTIQGIVPTYTPTPTTTTIPPTNGEGINWTYVFIFIIFLGALYLIIKAKNK